MTMFLQDFALAGAIDPQILDDGSLTSDWVSIKDFKQLAFVVNVGATDTTVDVKLQSADDSSGTNAADISGKAVTQLSATDDNKQVVLRLRADQVNSADTHVAVVVTAGNGTVGAYVSAACLGFHSGYSPANEYDVASVAQIV